MPETVFGGNLQCEATMLRPPPGRRSMPALAGERPVNSWEPLRHPFDDSRVPG
jgi:hypothetical protein